jgi:hypothetical protein
MWCHLFVLLVRMFGKKNHIRLQSWLQKGHQYSLQIFANKYMGCLKKYDWYAFFCIYLWWFSVMTDRAVHDCVDVCWLVIIHSINFVLLCFKSLSLICFSRNGTVSRLQVYWLHGVGFVEHRTQNWICFQIVSCSIFLATGKGLHKVSC